MDDVQLDALWRMYSDNVSQSRHHENERAAIAGVVLTIGAAIAGLVTFDGTIAGLPDFVLAILMAAVGLFGAAFSYKNYERSCYHFARARVFRNAVDDAFLSGRIAELHDAADAAHEKRFGRFRKLRLHHWWLALNVFITIIGLAIAFIAAASPGAMAGVPQ